MRLRLPVLLLAGLTLTGCGSEPVPDQLAAPGVLPATPSASAAPPPVGETAPLEPSPVPSETATLSSEPSPAVEGNPSAAEVAELEQFIRGYYDAVNNALETGAVAGVNALSIPECNCRSVTDFIARNSALGVVEGSRSTVHGVTVQVVGPEWASVAADVSATDGRIIGPDGATVMTIDNGERGQAVHAVLRTPDGWKIAQVVE